MAFFNGWPWTQFQEQNLDWIIRKLKELEQDTGDLKEALENLEQTISQDVSDILNQWLIDGTLQTLLQNIVSDRQFMAASLQSFTPTNYQAGDLVRTAGYNTSGDGGSGVYVINNSNGLLIGGIYYLPVSGESAKAYGVDCDGIQDNADQIMNALQYTNMLVFRPDDVIILSKPVMLVNNTTIIGNGATVYVRNNNNFTDGSAMFTGNGLKNITIDNIRIQRDTGTYHFYAISIINGDNIKITRSYFRNGIGYMIRLSGSNNTIIEDCQCINVDGITGDPGGFIYLQGGTNNSFRHIRCDSITDHAVYLDGSVTVLDFSIDDIKTANQKTNTLTNGAIIAVYGNCARGTISNIVGRLIKTGIGIYYRDGSMPNHIEVHDIVLRGVSADGIEIFGNSAAPSVPTKSYIDVSDCIINEVTQDGFSIRYANRCTIKGAFVMSADRNSIALSYSSTNFIMNCVSVDCYGAIQIGQQGAANNNMIVNPIDISCTYATNVSYTGSTGNRISEPIAFNCTNPVSAITGNYIRNTAFTPT